ncbi:MAG: 4Fe-4S dicluster domain-containing protein [Synergistaceae bacterium]|nr:4Fe-4S dicluster domain-containing protein [Synergistaceae bacterium]
MSQKGFRYDMNKCLECRACVVSCKDKNDLPVGVNFIKIREDERGKFPNVFVWFTLQMCRHCSNPACVSACPTGAMTKDSETGMVSVNKDVCIGCGACVKACPYNAVQVRDDIKKAAKCNGCLELQKNGELPVCVASCTSRCLTLVDLDDLQKESGLVRAVNEDISPEKTGPNLYYKPKKGMKA